MRLRFPRARFPKKLAIILGLGVAAIALTAVAFTPRPVIKYLQPVRWVGKFPAETSLSVDIQAVNAGLPSGTLGSAQSTVTLHPFSARASWHDTSGIASAALVSRAVGFNVTGKYRVPVTKRVTANWVPAWSIKGYPVYQGYQYQVWSDPLIGSSKLLGTGKAGKPVDMVWKVGPAPTPKGIPTTPPPVRDTAG